MNFPENYPNSRSSLCPHFPQLNPLCLMDYTSYIPILAWFIQENPPFRSMIFRRTQPFGGSRWLPPVINGQASWKRRGSEDVQVRPDAAGKDHNMAMENGHFTVVYL